jgi:hypothetical protein
MKKLILLSAIAFSGLFYNTANAQIRVRFGINFFPHRVFIPRPEIAVQPPVYYSDAPVNYDGNDDYYYLPDEDAYYDVTDQCYYYLNGDNWVSAAYLPGYDNFDWRTARRYEIRQPRPYLDNDFYRQKYFNNGYAQHFNNGPAGGYAARLNNAPAQNFYDRGREGFGRPNNANMNGRQFNQGDDRRMAQNVSHDMGNRQQQHFAQNNRGFDGHNNGRRMF